MKFVMGLLIACLLLNGCNRSVSYEEALTENQGQFENTDKFEDSKFLVESKSRNMLAMEVLTLAADSGYSSVAVSFAKNTFPDHKKFDEEIVDLAKKKDIRLPDELSPEHQIILSQLTSVTRRDFDNTFSRTITQINEENNLSFTSKATQASDPDLRAFAARKLDLFRAHSQSVSAMKGQLLNPNK